MKGSHPAAGLAAHDFLPGSKADKRADRALQCDQSAHRQEGTGQDFEHNSAVKAGINELPKEQLPWNVTADQRPMVTCINIMTVNVENPTK
jgi:hypothetical protein